MTAAALFQTANQVAMIAWLLLVVSLFVFPRIRVYLRVIVPVGFSLLYLGAIFPGMASGEGGFSTITEVRTLFINDWALLAGWVHYLAFDFLVGILFTEKALERGVSRWFILPCLPLTFMLGPVGYLGLMLVNALKRSNPPPAAEADAAG